MKRFVMILLLGLACCGRQADLSGAQAPVAKPIAFPATAAQSAMPVKAGAEMKLIPIPKDKAQLARLISMGYTVHNDHMHPPGVKSCPLDKNGASVVE